MEHTNRVGGFGMDTDGLEDDVFDDEFEGEDDGEETEYVPPTPKEQFTTLVQQVLSLAQGSPQVYERLHNTVAPFDKELAAKLRACKQADEELIAYCQKKVEQAKG